jgi:hypothetical protein
MTQCCPAFPYRPETPDNDHMYDIVAQPEPPLPRVVRGGSSLQTAVPKRDAIRPPPPPPPAGVEPPPESEQKTDADPFALLAVDQTVGADEAVLLHLAEREGELLDKLHAIEIALAIKLNAVLDSPKLASAVAGVLRDVSKVDSAVARRTLEVLRGAAELRSRRLLLDRERRRHDV